jgi:lipid-A-disaccharide synthase-like uncharacterized protein
MFSSFEQATFWLVVGFLAQSCFFLRFFIQWVVSERQGKSVIPIAFWYFSIAGALGLLSYAIYRKDPVFIVGQSTGLFIYFRNLVLVNRNKLKYKKIRK